MPALQDPDVGDRHFKTVAVLQVMGGQGSDMFEYFKILMLQGFVASRKHMDKILPLVEIMQTGRQRPEFQLALEGTLV